MNRDQGRSRGGDPATLRGSEVWIFDLDNTLYPARCDLFAQIDQRMGAFISGLLSIDAVEAKALQKSYFRRYGTTLRGLMLEHSIDPGDYLDYVHEIDLGPLDPNPRLDAALAALPGRKVIFTNGTKAHAERVLARLGIAGHFEAVFDIVASDYLPKPQRAPYDALVESLGIAPAHAVMVEDMPGNLAPAAAMGMTTVLVPGRREWRDEDPGSHVHYLIDDLGAWLYKLVHS